MNIAQAFLISIISSQVPDMDERMECFARERLGEKVSQSTKQSGLRQDYILHFPDAHSTMELRGELVANLGLDSEQLLVKALA